MNRYTVTVRVQFEIAARDAEHAKALAVDHVNDFCQLTALNVENVEPIGEVEP